MIPSRTEPKSTYDYLMVREDRAMERGYGKGVDATIDKLRDEIAQLFLDGKDEEAFLMRKIVDRIKVPPFVPRLLFDYRHEDHALRVLNADDKDAQPLPEGAP